MTAAGELSEDYFLGRAGIDEFEVKGVAFKAVR